MAPLLTSHAKGRQTVGGNNHQSKYPDEKHQLNNILSHSAFNCLPWAHLQYRIELDPVQNDEIKKEDFMWGRKLALDVILSLGSGFDLFGICLPRDSYLEFGPLGTR